MADRTCKTCGGSGWVIGQTCCGRGRIVWGAGPDDEPEETGQECCGAPDQTQEYCPDCAGPVEHKERDDG